MIAKIKKSILRQETSSRGGGIEITLDDFGYEGEKMACYQNYLGGGILGSIHSNTTFSGHVIPNDLKPVAAELQKYFHSLTNPDTEWEGCEYDEIQLRPISAY